MISSTLYRFLGIFCSPSSPGSLSFLLAQFLGRRSFAELTEKQLRRGSFRSTRELEDTIRRYIDQRNEAPRPFVWGKTADQILATIARFCQRTSDSGH